jgi:ATP-dependent DNA helicase RecG
VCFANAQGGVLILGVENQTKEPPPEQRIALEMMNSIVSRLRELTDGVAIANPQIFTHENGGNYIQLHILPSQRTIATTTSGKVFIRFTDKCYPISSEELTNLASEKTAFQWELVPHKINVSQIEVTSVNSFCTDIRNSKKVSDFIKGLSNLDILRHYQFIDENSNLSNLGILWLGTPMMRARLSYPLTIQYIVYNGDGEKVRKLDWHYHLHNPKELLIDIEKQTVELTYTTEIPDGIFRKQIRNFASEVVRELLINAIAHKKYTISGDIFIEVYPDKLKITNPGGLPLGVTKENILHERHRRNPHLIQALHDLNLMEGEGSGYDLVYEKLSRDGKPLPLIESEINKVAVTIYSDFIEKEVISVLDYIDKNFAITQKEFIVLGIVAREKKILSTQLSSQLQLSQEERLREWLGNLIKQNIIISRGIKKGTEYLLNPDVFSRARLNLKPALKTIEPYKLQALIQEDILHNGPSTISELRKRLSEALPDDVTKAVYAMVKSRDLVQSGSRKFRKYSLAKKR